MTPETPEIAPSLIRCPLVHSVDFKPSAPEEIEPLLFALRGNSLPLPHEGTQTFLRRSLLPEGRLDLCKQALGPDGGRRVAEAIRQSPEISTVLLGTNGLADSGAAAVAEMARDHPKLETLYLGCNLISGAGATQLAAAAVANPRLRSLWLKRNPLGDAGVAALAAQLANTSLEVVFTAKGFEGLMQAAQACPSLLVLKMPLSGAPPWTRQRMTELQETLRQRRQLQATEAQPLAPGLSLPYDIRSVYR